ncbi:methyltransferase domain-containing protein [Candidatus Roizmanbacteria bacterium]|nr:methyltransferase domain-containing protein [Candidatus Roizmanbacteria bacterium]
MRKQQKIWELEHQHSTSLPTLASKKPSSFVIKFLRYLRSKSLHFPLKTVDVGSGKGRNAIYLAKEGYSVYAIGYIQFTLDIIGKEAKRQDCERNIHLYKNAIDRKWPFRNNFFDLAIDCFSSIDIETRKGRIIYKTELLRTLKPGGYALVTVVSANDEIERGLMKKYPGKEKNSVIWPHNGKFQKNYDERELRDFYKEFQILKLQENKKRAFKLGKNYIATNYWMILRKPLAELL